MMNNKEFYITIYQCGLSYIIMDTLVASADILPEMTNIDAYLKSFWAYGTYGSSLPNDMHEV